MGVIPPIPVSPRGLRTVTEAGQWWAKPLSHHAFPSRGVQRHEEALGAGKKSGMFSADKQGSGSGMFTSTARPAAASL